MYIKSEAFKDTWAIFVDQSTMWKFRELIKHNQPFLNELNIFKATFDNVTAMITLPYNEQTKEIESFLFKKAGKAKDEGFWGQHEVGYKGKTWEKYC